MQLNNNSLSPIDKNFIETELNIDQEFFTTELTPFCICGKWFRDTTTFNGKPVLTGSIESIGISGVRPVLTGTPILRDDFKTKIIEDVLYVNYDGKQWAYSLYNFPYVDGLHRKIRSTTVTVDSHLLLEIVSADKCLYWIVAPMGVSA